MSASLLSVARVAIGQRKTDACYLSDTAPAPKADRGRPFRAYARFMETEPWHERAVPLVLGAVIAGFVVVDYGWSIGIGFAALVAGVTAALARRTVWPLLVAAAAGTLVFSVWPLVMVACYYVAVSSPRPTRVIATGLTAYAALAGLPVVLDALGNDLLVEGDPVPASQLVILAAVVVALPTMAGLWVRARRQLAAGLVEQAAQRERERRALAARASSAERAGLAREMHDVVAHKVALMVVHAGALEVQPPDRTTAEAAALIRSTGREALAGLREVVEVLRTPNESAAVLGPPPSLVDLDSLLESSRATGLVVRRYDLGEPVRVSDTSQRVLYRVTQEALTNVHKHAPGAEVEVTLGYYGDAVEVVISNTGGTSTSVAAGSGYGLLGLRERVALVDGVLTAGPAGDGFVVRARVPLR
ncbi:signal transduction histidine kinase [Kribbella voronezhensis]|uniref:histidine kinase n=2 Tax=Kribbella voronezhensis TaxID=2512212 RepID=A0A4R7TA54_9ACTN|nr:signal transduction histidine kinase [Kribbella voronezhensis]